MITPAQDSSVIFDASLLVFVPILPQQAFLGRQNTYPTGLISICIHLLTLSGETADKPMEEHPLFINRVGVIATMHHKEKCIAPILKQKLGVEAVVPQNFDTDSFGTFTREIERAGDQLQAARLKAEKALAVTGETLAFASEGTFGPHPATPFLSCNREIVLLLDKKNGIELFGQEFSTETNYNHQIIQNYQEAQFFSKTVGFPDHGLVVMSFNQDGREIKKGITTEEQLFQAVTSALKKSLDGKIHIETDMRALYNPTRMKNIEKATCDLIEKINCLCPECSWPGFEIIERKRGLRCAACNLPTANIISAIYRCKKCSFSQETLFPNGLEKADPAECMYCNP